MSNDHSFEGLKIMGSHLDDLAVIFNLFDSAINYQKQKGYELWPRFSEKLIITEIKEERHFKIVNDNTIVCIFSVMYNDPIIWGIKDKDPAVYLHRIATNPLYKGKGIMRLIRSWAIDHAGTKNKKFVRMDTWGNNQNLRAYYINCGFNYIGQQYLTNTDGLPSHYGGSVLSLFEIKVA